LRLDFAELALWKRLRADDYLLYGGSDKHKLRYKQRTELDGSRSDEYCHHAGDIHVHIGKRFNQHEPNGDDHLHADRNQCLWLDQIHGKSDGNCVRQSIGDNNHLVPRRNTRRSICRLHNSRQRWLSALHLFRKYEFQLLSVA